MVGVPMLKAERISRSGPKLSDAQTRNFKAIKYTRHERGTVQRMLERGASRRQIARGLGRSPSTVSSEVATHKFVLALL